MIVSTIQVIVIAFAVGFILGTITGWRLTFNSRLAKIQEQQIKIEKLKEDYSKLTSRLRSYKMGETKEWVEEKVSGAKDGASSMVNNIRSKIWKNKE